MAQVSIQYSLHEDLQAHDEKAIKKFLDAYPGVKSVSLNMENGLLCVDYDDTGVSQKVIDDALNREGYEHTMLDKLTF